MTTGKGKLVRRTRLTDHRKKPLLVRIDFDAATLEMKCEREHGWQRLPLSWCWQRMNQLRAGSLDL